MKTESNKSKHKDDFLHIFIGGSIGNDYRWIRLGITMRMFVFPPKLTEPQDITCFADGLKETIQYDLKIALEAQEKLKELRKKRIMMILDYISEDKQWFYFTLEKHLFSEYFVISEWIRYWLNLWSKINKDYTPPVRPNHQFSDIEIQRAKMYPIERLYKGNLRNSGKRFVGLCPFHKERTPSFYIFENNTWHCFGACSTGGDAINFAMKLYDITFPVAVRRLLYGHN